MTSISENGLSHTDASARLLRDGYNRLPPPDHRSPLAMVGTAAAQPMVLLLLACTAVYAVLGEPFDAVALLVSVMVVIGISGYQGLRTQRVLESLRDMASPRSTVVRAGEVVRISSHEVVVDDRLIVQEGDRLACDAVLVDAHAMRVDESLLTGESVPVDKAAGCDGRADEGARLHAGTLVVQGDGIAIVTATGQRTALGRIGGSMAKLRSRDSRLQAELKQLVRAVAVFALVLCLAIAWMFAWQRESWSEGLLVGLTLAMAIVPEEFAVVWTVMLALGAWRLARANVLTRQPQAIEALGAVTVLCVDKTGTLTRNCMQITACSDAEGNVASIDAGGGFAPAFEPVFHAAAHASVREGLEPMDQAIFRLLPDWKACGVLHERQGVQPGRPFVTQRWGQSDGSTQIYMKGAPEVVLSSCSDDEVRLQRLLDQAQVWAEGGMRVIAVARARGHAGAPTPERAYKALGLIAFHDPLRDDIPASVQACRGAGLRVVMLTGDSPATALAIARSAGLADARSAALTGAQIDEMNEAAFELEVTRVAVFARVTPAQKLRIVQALQRRGEVVAMTGDGVNDGPALRAADVGVAMGKRGTDVAREAAAIVLLDDRFASLVEAVRAGRRIFANLQKAVGYLLAVHIPIVGLSLLPLFGGPLLLLPLHIVLFELIIDPACSLVFEAEPSAKDAMTKPPRAAEVALVDRKAAFKAVAFGGAALAFALVLHWVGVQQGASDEILRLMAVTSIVIGNLAMLHGYRGRGAYLHANKAFQALVLGVCLLGLAVLCISPLRNALGLADVDPWVVGGLLGSLAAWQVFKLACSSPKLELRQSGHETVA